jgi:hypothetical protein
MCNHAVALSKKKKKRISGKVVNRHDLGGWGSRMSYIALDLSLKVVKRLDLAGTCKTDCTISGADGLTMWCAAPTVFDPEVILPRGLPNLSYLCRFVSLLSV